MSSLFDKFRTLVKASIPGRSSPYESSSDGYVSGAEIEERLDKMDEQERKKREAAEATDVQRERLETAPDPEAELAKVVEELEAEQTPVLPEVEEAAVREAKGLLDSAEKEIAVPADASDAVKKSAQQAQELIDKARGAMGDKAQPADESILQKASRTLDSAAKGLGVPAEATDVVKKSAQQASDLIEKARGLIGEKSAELADAVDLPLPTIPPPSDDDEPSSGLDDIKRRLG